MERTMNLNRDVVRANLIDPRNWTRTQRGQLTREWSGLRLSVLWTKGGYSWLIHHKEKPLAEAQTPMGLASLTEAQMSATKFQTEGQALRSIAEAVINTPAPEIDGMT